MDSAAIISLLSENFGEGIEASPATLAGDPFVTVPAEQLREIIAFLKNDPALAMNQLKLVTGVDRGEWIESVYHLYSYEHFHALTLKVKLDRNDPRVPSIADLFGAAEWHERESFDMVGIRYEGNPNLRRILLPEDWAGHPLRLDYQQPKEYHGISNEAAV